MAMAKLVHLLLFFFGSLITLGYSFHKYKSMCAVLCLGGEGKTFGSYTIPDGTPCSNGESTCVNGDCKALLLKDIENLPSMLEGFPAIMDDTKSSLEKGQKSHLSFVRLKEILKTSEKVIEFLKSQGSKKKKGVGKRKTG